MRTALACVAAVLAGCTDLYSLAAHGYTEPTVTAQDTHAVPAVGGVEITIDFAAQNPNPYPLDFDGVDYTVSSQGVTALTGSHGSFSVDENGSAVVPLSGTITADALAQLHLVPGQSTSYTLSGTLHVKTPAGVGVDLAFSTDGTLIVPATAP
jgi:LEA14-like dessication related protein